MGIAVVLKQMGKLLEAPDARRRWPLTVARMGRMERSTRVASSSRARTPSWWRWAGYAGLWRR